MKYTFLLSLRELEIITSNWARIVESIMFCSYYHKISEVSEKLK